MEYDSSSSEVGSYLLQNHMTEIYGCTSTYMQLNKCEVETFTTESSCCLGIKINNKLIKIQCFVSVSLIYVVQLIRLGNMIYEFIEYIILMFRYQKMKTVAINNNNNMDNRPTIEALDTEVNVANYAKNWIRQASGCGWESMEIELTFQHHLLTIDVLGAISLPMCVGLLLVFDNFIYYSKPDTGLKQVNFYRNRCVAGI